ncbi:MAG: AbrB/MazE/SpoVT family DNA-binding domain-containing protein [Candidatus Heimdallarchaeota archaeon]
MPLEFKRKVIDNHGSLQVNIPVEIAEHLGIKKGDTIAISLDDKRFVCRKVEK